MSESRIERTRTADLEAYRDRLRPGLTDDCPKFLGTVTTKSTLPTAPLVTYLVNPILGIDSEDSEGATPTFDTNTTGTIPVVFLEAPSLGDTCVCYSAGGRWVAEKGSSSQVCCTWFCSSISNVPSSIKVTDPLYGTFTLPLTRSGPICSYALDTHFPFAGADGCPAGMVPVHLAFQGSNFTVQINSNTTGSKSECNSFCPTNNTASPVNSVASCLTQISIPVPPAVCNFTTSLNFSLSANVAPTCGTAATPNPLYVLYGGSCPSTGESLPLTWSFEATQFQNIGCICSVCGLACGTCSIPKKDLQLVATNPILGDETLTLVFSSTSLSWATKNCDSSGLLYTLACANGKLNFLAQFWITGACPGPGGTTGNCSSTGIAPGAFTQTAFTCTPLSATYTSTSGSCPTVTSAGFTKFVITDPTPMQSQQPQMCATFVVTGCNAFPYPGITVSVSQSSGSTVLATGTTDSAGNVFLMWQGLSGNYFVSFSGFSSRFVAPANQTLQVSCGTTIGIGFVANPNGAVITYNTAPGFHCTSCCLLPLASTLFFTDNVYQGATLTFDPGTGTWDGPFDGATTDYPGCSKPDEPACEPITIESQPVVTLGGSCNSIQVTYQANPENFPCPGAGLGEEVTCTWAATFTCIDGGGIMVTAGGTPENCDDGTPVSLLYCTPPMMTITE
jgi:hypothetical protein